MNDAHLNILLIAVDRYDHWPRLRGAVAGAEKFEEVLAHRNGLQSSQVTTLVNSTANTANIERTLRSFAPDGTRELGSDDRLIIYFAGHGVYDPMTESGYLIPVDAAADGTSGCLSYDLLTRMCRAIVARHILVVVDACFAGAGLRGDHLEVTPNLRVLRRLHQRPSRQLMASGGLEPVDDAGFGGLSPFTWALTSTIMDFDQPVATTEQIFSRIRNIVSDNANQLTEFGQLPNAGHQGGQFLWFFDEAAKRDYEQKQEDVPNSIAPKSSSQLSHRARIPQPDLHYIPDGRTVDDLLTSLASDGVQRVLVTGMGGVGKSELVLQSLAKLDPKRWPRLHYVDVGLAPDELATVDPVALFSTLLAHVGEGRVSPGDDELELRRQWQTLTDDPNLLLVIDNVPHPRVWETIDPARTCTVIVLSRWRLPAFDKVITVAPIAEALGTRLALAIANVSTPGRLASELACRLHDACDGLPLAIRVAAAAIDQNPWLDVSTFISSLKAVEASAPKPEDWNRRVLERLRLSLEYLDPILSERWHRLSVFSGSFQKSAVSAVWTLETADGPLHDLVVRHLVMAQPVMLPSGALQVRFKLHDLLKSLSIETAGTASEHHAALSRLARYYAESLFRLDQLNRSSANLDLRDHNFLITQDMDSLKGVIDFVKADQDWASAEHLVAFALSETLSRRLAAPEHLELAEKALITVARWQNQEPEACDRYRQKLLLEKAQALRAVSRPEEAETTLKEGLELAKQCDSRPNQAAFLGSLGSLLLSQPNSTQQALVAFRSALKYLDEDSSKQERSALLNNCGNAFLRLGNLKAAKDAYWISQSIDEEVGDQVGVATTQANLANIAIFEGEYAEAARLAENAAQMEIDLGLEQAHAQSLQIAGKARFLCGDLTEADNLFRAALEIHVKQGQLISATKARANLAAVAYQTGNLSDAYLRAREAIKEAHVENHLSEAAGSIRTLAMIYLERNRLRSAFKAMKCALSLHTQSHSRSEMIEDVLGLVQLFVTDQQPMTALGYLTQAEEWTHDHGQPHHRDKCNEMRIAVETALSPPDTNGDLPKAEPDAAVSSKEA